MNAQHNATPTHGIKMFANLDQTPPLFIPLEGNDPKKVALSVHGQLKGRNARIGLDRVMALITGQEEMFKGYEIVEIATHNNHVKPKFAAEQKPEPDAAKPEPQSTAQTSKLVGVRGSGRNYSALSNQDKTVKPLKKGTLGTRIMEFLARPEGATMKFMVEHSGNKTSGGVNDVLGWQIKQKGYGLKYDATKGTYHLVMPEGQKELIYT